MPSISLSFSDLQDCPTRWGSTYKMVQRLNENMAYVKTILQDDRKCSHLVPSWQDVDCFAAIQTALSPVADLTDIMCGDKYVTISSMKSLLNILKSDLEEDPKEPELVNDIRQTILDTVEEKADSSTEIYNLTSFLDPRYKVSMIMYDKLISSWQCV